MRKSPYFKAVTQIYLEKWPLNTAYILLQVLNFMNWLAFRNEEEEEDFA